MHVTLTSVITYLPLVVLFNFSGRFELLFGVLCFWSEEVPLVFVIVTDNLRFYLTGYVSLF